MRPSHLFVWQVLRHQVSVLLCGAMRGDIEGQPRSDAEAYGVLPGADESGIRQARSPKRSVGTLVLGGIAAAGLVAVTVF